MKIQILLVFDLKMMQNPATRLNTGSIRLGHVYITSFGTTVFELRRFSALSDHRAGVDSLVVSVKVTDPGRFSSRCQCSPLGLHFCGAGDKTVDPVVEIQSV